MAIIPSEFVPLVVIPSTTSATTRTSSDTEWLDQPMEIMSFQTEEIKRLEAQINILKDQKARSDNAHEIELQRAQKKIERLQKAEKEASIGHTIG